MLDRFTTNLMGTGVLVVDFDGKNIGLIELNGARGVRAIPAQSRMEMSSMTFRSEDAAKLFLLAIATDAKMVSL